MRIPDMPNINPADVVDVLAKTRSLLPSPREAADFAGLGLLAAVEAIELPVAVAMGVGSLIAQWTEPPVGPPRDE